MAGSTFCALVSGFCASCCADGCARAVERIHGKRWGSDAQGLEDAKCSGMVVVGVGVVARWRATDQRELLYRAAWSQGRKFAGHAVASCTMMIRSRWKRGAILLAAWVRFLGNTGAQSSDAQWLELDVSEAVESGCLHRSEVPTILQLWESRELSQQSVVRALGTERGLGALVCLLQQEDWQQRLSTFPFQSARKRKAGIRMRMGGGMRSGDAGAMTDVQWNSATGKGWDISGRWTRGSTEDMKLVLMVTKTVEKGGVSVGSLSPRLGQGVALWSASAFDDLGGMEGSHRMASGWMRAGARARGTFDGMAWQRKGATSKSAQFLGWAAGKWWQGEGLLAGWGKWGHSPHRLWIVRTEWMPGVINGKTRQDGRLLNAKASVFGIGGGGEKMGWSWRWEWAAFAEGWAGRCSVLRTWTRQWEAHAVLAREHADHPGWHSGEWRSSPIGPEGQTAWRIEAGMTWQQGKSSKAEWRWRRLESLSPGVQIEEQLDIRCHLPGHRFRLRGDVFPHDASTWQWSVRYDRLWAGGAWGGESKRRLHVGWSSHPGTGSGGVVAAMLGWTGRSDARWQMGMGQAWGDEWAPPRYVTSWNGRPAHAFRKRQTAAFLHWRGGGRKWRCRLRWAWTDQNAVAGALGWGHPWLDVEFVP